MPSSNPPDSPYVRFGRTDLYVSRLCQGTAFRHLPRSDDPQAERVLRHCLEVGVNFFDSSNAYGWGGSERVLGKAVAGRRGQVVICTKVAASYPPEREGMPARSARFTRDYLLEQAEGSLARLGTDYIDLYLLHQPDQGTPAGEIADSMEALRQSGKIRHWGVSNHSAVQVEAYLALSQTAGAAPIAGVEDYYTIAGMALDEAGCSRVRRLEQETFPLLQRSGLGLLAFSPLDTGHLAAGRNVAPEHPLAALIREIDRSARKLGVTRAAVCVAWVLTRSAVTCVLAGAESPEHVDENQAGTRLVIPIEMLERLDSASTAFRDRYAAQ